ncbi:hypothetical protein [Sutcliffiella cohnii]|uniref:hypothetical protein n=1 Tax=Sutcliffiella cohnii TaxID=33932 RepID=UPI0008347D11|nr:hypothetical protein [Sutcliffiella cohnii]
MRKFLKVTLEPFLISIVIMIAIYAVYVTYHFGFGKVTVPEWYTQKTGIPFPVSDVIKYWNSKGQKLALLMGVITFSICLLFRLFKPKFGKKVKEEL